MQASNQYIANPSPNGLSRAGTGFVRSLARRCPFCGSPNIFENWFGLKKHCPGCGSLFAPEDGYMLGSYVVNLGTTSIVGVLLAIYFIFGTSMSIASIQIITISLMVAMPLFFYGYAQLFWICLDLVFNDVSKFDPDRPHHS